MDLNTLVLQRECRDLKDAELKRVKNLGRLNKILKEITGRDDRTKDLPYAVQVAKMVAKGIDRVNEGQPLENVLNDIRRFRGSR